MSKATLKRFLLGEGVGPSIARGTLGAGAGAYLGHEVTPRLFGYEGDEAATNISTLLDAALYGTLAGMGPRAVGRLAAKQPAGFAGSVAGSEIIPVAMHGAQEGTKALKEFNPPTATDQAEALFKSPEARGAAGGAATAGIGSLLTGLLRPRSEGERRDSTSRTGMVSNDLLKYLLPAMLAGGVLGNVSKDNNEPPA